MTVDFSAVNVGDRVRLTRDNGDEYTFQVYSATGAALGDRYFRWAYPGEWDNLEILKPRPAEGYYIYSGRVFYFDGEEWSDATNSYAHHPIARDYFDRGYLTRLVEETP